MGGVDQPLAIFSNSKVIQDILLIFLIVDKIQHFCQKIKINDLIWAFLWPFFASWPWNSKTVQFFFFDPYTEIHNFTNIHASMSDNEFKIVKNEFWFLKFYSHTSFTTYCIVDSNNSFKGAVIYQNDRFYLFTKLYVIMCLTRWRMTKKQLFLVMMSFIPIVT